MFINNINISEYYRPFEIPHDYEMPESLRDAVCRLAEILHVPIVIKIPPLSTHSFQYTLPEEACPLSTRIEKAAHPTLIINLIQEAAPLFNNEEWILCFQSIIKMEKEKDADVKNLLEFIAREITRKGSRRHFAFSSLQVAQLIEIGGKYNISVRRFVNLVFDEALLHFKKFNDQELYKVMEGLRKWRMRGDSKESFIESLVNHWFLQCGSLSPFIKEISLKTIVSIYRFLLADCEGGEKPFREEILSRFKECTLADLVEILRAISDSKQFDKELVLAVGERMKEERHVIDKMEYHILLQELTRVNYCDGLWFQELIAEMSCLPEKFQLQQQLILFNAIVKTGFCTEEAKAFALKLIQKNELEQCPFGHLTLFMVVFGFLFNDTHQELSHRWIETLKNSPNISYIDRSKLYQAMLLTGYPAEEALTYLGSPKNLSTHSSIFQKRVVENILEKLTRKNRHITLKEEVLIGNTHVDVLVEGATFRQKPLILQIDGPFHYTISSETEMADKQTMQTIINTRVLSALGYQVARIGLYGKKRFSKDLFIS